MLLGSTNTRQQYESEEELITQLLTQNRYAEAYFLLLKESPHLPSTQYNMALCNLWAGNYREALINLDKAQSNLPAVPERDNHQNNPLFIALRTKQNQENDYLQGITAKYVFFFGSLVRDAIIRLKTDCWLHLEEYAKVLETATPMANKNYKNIADALQIAKNHISL